ncbi:MAG TPA: HAD-IA family hydrolase [Candidatus Elarobacter sp.]|nr:HAD-IA family hydrolase [Candidatus Elarobacter sp.]
MGVAGSLRALLFDFDGLVLDTESTEFRAWSELYERHGHTFELERWAAAIGTLQGFDPEEHLASLGTVLEAEALQERERRNLDLCDLEAVRPGVAELLDAAERRGIATAIVSSSSDGWIARHLDARGLSDRFGTIACANGDTKRAKPRPTLYLEALERLRVRAGEAVAFEDSPNGVAAAKAAGIFCVAVPNPITARLDLSRADLVAESLLDVTLAMLEERLAAPR